jgi:1,5-anhydro-D-fructose reductase (1,5-anhydro-D-mannitol-forming)
MKWALVGASTIAGQWMVDAIRASGDEIVAVVSGSAERAQAFAAQHHIAHALTTEAELDGLGVQAVYISNTNDKHEASVVRAAAAAQHVLCEKPLAVSLEAAHRMVQACAQAGVVMVTNHHLRHNAAHRAMREQLNKHALGRVSAVRLSHSVYLPQHLQGWRLSDKGAGGGVVLDIAVHNADSLAFLLGEYPTHVCAMTSNTGMAKGMEDTAMSLWQYASGITAFTHQGFNTPFAQTHLQIHGDKGSLHGAGILTQAPGGSLQLSTDSGTHALTLDNDNLYQRVVRNMHAAIRGESHANADGAAGLRALAVAHAILKSAASQQTEAVDYP